MNVKTGFRRIVALFLSFAMVFSTFAGLLPGGIVFAADTDPEMHIIIQHWHAGEPEPENVDVTINSTGIVANESGGADSNYVGGNLTFNVKTKSTETFAGFAVSAGNDCVTLDPDEKTSEGAAKTPSITVKYDANVHLVKVHVFYSAKPKLVPGTRLEVGTAVGRIGKYEDTKTQTWGSLDSDLQQKIKDAIGSDGVINPNELDSDDLIKLYNTSEGLHTDKTATPVYNSDTNNAGTTDKDVKGDGTRVFDINLEAWYNDQATAKVGLILDASGSMAFISEGLEPMQFSYDNGKGYNLGNGNNLDVNANEYLTPDQVNQILNKNLTDNSKLSYSDYSYYIYDTRDFTQEFVPLAYWGGKDNTGKVAPIARYAFNNSLAEEIKGGTATYIKHAADNSSGQFEEDSVPTYKPEPIFGDKGLDICQTAPVGGVMLGVVPNTNKFTITLGIGSEKTGKEQVQNNTSILLLTDGTNTYNLFRGSVTAKEGGGWSNSSNRLRMTENDNTNNYIINENDVFNADGTTVRTWSFTFDFDKKEITYSGKYSSGGAASGTQTLTAAFDVSKLKIIVGGAEKEFEKYSEVFVQNLIIKDDSDTEIANYPLKSDLSNKKSGGASATLVQQAYVNKSGEFEDTALPETIEQVPTYTDGALNLTQTAKSGGILLDAVPTDKNNFSISFNVKKVDGVAPSHEAELVYMGPSDTSKTYYNIFRANGTSGNSSNHIRFSANSNYGTRASGQNAFNDTNWKPVTFTVENGTVTVYVNGVTTNDGGNPTANLSTLSKDDDFAIILGGLKDEYNGADILIKDFCIYDKALSETEVEAIGNTDSTYIALSDDGKVIGKYPKEMENATPDQRKGWYFVNSGSDLKDFYDTIGTAKELKGLPAGEVIKNEIDIYKMPVSDDVLSNLIEANAWKGNHGYIATSGKDFTGTGYLWNGKDSATEINVGTDKDYDCAITLPEGTTRKDMYNGYSPCVFFIDDCGFLRCFYNNGGSTHTKDSKGNDKYTDELRSGVSYVFKKEDNQNIKYEDLQYALGQFTAQLHNATPNSMISAVRFSNQKVLKDGDEYKVGTPDVEGVDGKYSEDELKKLVLLDWTSDTKEISQILSLTRGEGENAGGTNGFDTSDPTDKGLATTAEALKQYNYGMTGGTYTWTGFQAYTDFLDSRIKYGKEGEEGDPAKKYIILFTDGMDNMLDGGTVDEQNYAVDLANALKEKGYTIFCVVLKNDSFETGSDTSGNPNRGARVQQYMAKIAGNTSTDKKTYSPDAQDEEYAKKYEALSAENSSTRYIFEADDVTGLTEAFTGEILEQISSSLLDYTVQDYIDPRFDLVDNMGNTIVLGSNVDDDGNRVGDVTVLNKDGIVTGDGLGKDYPEGYENEDKIGTIRINNNETAVLCYDKSEGRYYLEWPDQNIPGTTPGQNSLTIWSRTFRVKAKDDFIGGNAILSNGNVKNENWVFYPDDKDVTASSGTGDAILDKEKKTAQVLSKTPMFPRASRVLW